MPMQQDQTQGRNEVIDSIINSVTDASPRLATARISKIPPMTRETHDYEKYFVPKVVSIGPYHYGNPKFESVEKLKPVFAMKLVENNKEILESLHTKLCEPDMVRDLRSYYEDNPTTKFSDMDLAKMMLLDCCFILYYIKYIFRRKREDWEGLDDHQIVFIQEDLFLLENQIPFKVLMEGMKKLTEFNWLEMIKFIYENIILASRKPERKWWEAILYIRIGRRRYHEEHVIKLVRENEPNHLLHLLLCALTHSMPLDPMDNLGPKDQSTFRNVRELVDVGIRFRPSDAMCYVKFYKGRWSFTANVELPSITVDDSTKLMLLNLIAYEKRSSTEARGAWVTSYVCFLHSLIEDQEDVKVLRKAGVLQNSLRSDKEVAELFNEIRTDLVPNNLAYSGAKYKIQRHYENWNDTLMSQLNHECVTNPCAFFSLFGVISLFLSAVQTYFTVWTPKGECDDLCVFLKKNHHL